MNIFPEFKKGLAVIIINEPILKDDLFTQKIKFIARDIASLVHKNDCFILVGDEWWIKESISAGRKVIPFMENQKQYWGPPASDVVAIKELERLRAFGVTHIVFAWPSFWWLDYYSEFNKHLITNFRCVLNNNLTVIFDLH